MFCDKILICVCILFIFCRRRRHQTLHQNDRTRKQPAFSAQQSRSFSWSWSVRPTTRTKRGNYYHRSRWWQRWQWRTAHHPSVPDPIQPCEQFFFQLPRAVQHLFGQWRLLWTPSGSFGTTGKVNYYFITFIYIC